MGMQPSTADAQASLLALRFLVKQAPAARQVLDQPRARLDKLWHRVCPALDNLIHETRQGLVGPRLRVPAEGYQHKGPYFLHDRIAEEGLPGSAMLVASALAFDTIQEAVKLFEIDEETFKRRAHEKHLSASDSERSLRLSRVVTEAARVLGSAKAAKGWVHEPNHALGGRAPISLLKTAQGESVVLDELNAQEHLAPV